MRGMVWGLVVVLGGCASTRAPAPGGVVPVGASAGAGSKPPSAAVTPGAMPVGAGAKSASAAGVADAAARANTVLADGVGRPVNRALVAQGYRPTAYRGQLFYCRKQKLTGSQFTQKVCLTEQEAALQERIAQDEMNKRNSAGKCLPPLCPKTKE